MVFQNNINQRKTINISKNNNNKPMNNNNKPIKFSMTVKFTI